MASLKSFVSLAILLLAASGFFFNPPHAAFLANADRALVESICRQTTDFDFCTTTLLKDPRTAGADLHGLGLISISLTVVRVGETIAIRIPEALRSTSDDLGKQRLEESKTDYEQTLGILDNAYKSGDKKSYQEAQNWISTASKKIVDSANIYDRDPVGKSPIQDDNDKVLLLTTITWQIMERLIRG